MALNVNREVTDQYYRYKMPRLIAKVEGKGNGIKTVIVNMVDIAKALGRPPTYPTKFFGCELGAQTQFDLKNDRYIVNGSHDDAKLQDLLDVFIKKFVLCTECDNPETHLAVKQRNGIIQQRCKACGHQTLVDMRHKLTTFIVKNPPESIDGASPNKKVSKSKAKDNDQSVNGNSANEENGADDDDDWVDDTSADAVAKRMKEQLSMGAQGLTSTADLDKPEQDRINIFYNFVKTRRDDGQLNECSTAVITSVYAEAQRLEILDKAPLVLVELLFDENIAKQIPKYRALLLRFTQENTKAQRYLLGGLEQLIGKVHRETLLPKVLSIFKTAYDTDILEEDTLLEWDQKISKKYVDKETSQLIHQKAKPLIDWLKSASEESDEDEEDVQIAFTNEKPQVEKRPEPIKVKDGDKEIDIDDI
ncbi:DgyrCDS12235 [Dimorphilus gyrociliatus]|uniref:Eukaryotic translation initiation factor 5 n=1 Tax=Dimorphilus gyrociliatus TaxID=2664684 RepID=A0A7I8W5Y0_9ANNE|nr:DgyrCDS12235 [Dimorphilus gyrociliatus]